MRIRAITAAIAAVLLVCASAAQAQSPTRPPHARMARVAMLCLITCDLAGFAAIDDELRRLGWTEGVNLAVDRRSAGGHAELLPALAAELVRRGPDAIIAMAPQPSLAARDATASIPVVFSFVADPVGVGLVRDLARPGGNVTGVASLVPDANIAKVFGLLRELLPGSRRVAVLINPSNPVHRRFMAEQAPGASQRFGFELEVVEVSSPEGVSDGIAEAKRRGADALFVAGDNIFHTPPERVPALVAAARLPAIYFSADLVRAGGLMSYGPDFPWILRRQAQYVDRILRGAAAADLPVERPTVFRLMLNARAAAALGLTLPTALLAAADDVIE